MLVTFTCYELGFEEYALLVPVFAVAGVVVLMIRSTVSLPVAIRTDGPEEPQEGEPLYRRDREGSAKGSASEGKGVREAGEVTRPEFTRKEEARAQKKAERDERRRQRKEARAERHARWRAWWSEKLARLKFVKKESADETHKSPANADTTEEHSAEGDSVERESAERDSAEAESAERSLRRNIRQKEKVQRETRRGKFHGEKHCERSV